MPGTKLITLEGLGGFWRYIPFAQTYTWIGPPAIPDIPPPGRVAQGSPQYVEAINVPPKPIVDPGPNPVVNQSGQNLLEQSLIPGISNTTLLILAGIGLLIYYYS